MDNSLDKFTAEQLFEVFDNRIVVCNDDHELCLYKTDIWGVPQDYAVVLNSRHLRSYRTLKFALDFFNKMLSRLELSTDGLMEEFKRESDISEFRSIDTDIN